MTESYITVENGTGIRLDAFLAVHFPDISRSRIKSMISSGLVKVNDASVKPSLKLSDGNVIYIQIPDPEILQVEAENIPLDILYEDDDLIIVNKPKGMPVHPAPGHYTGTLVNGLMFHCKDSLSGINGVLRPGIVHRIDMNTTGALIVCKNDNSHTCIASQLEKHSINRIYVGIVNGTPDFEGTVNKPVGRHPADRKKMAVDVKNGKNAVTHYRVIKSFRGYSLCEFRLETGRTHQIRVHMASIGHPLLGDDVYGNGSSSFKTQGQTLHAKIIGFIHPSTGEYMEFEAPLPDYFLKILKRLENRN
ncbi:MAG: RluA family pseudouridine synthase [Lachnospiraceae bacterium]